MMMMMMIVYNALCEETQLSYSQFVITPVPGPTVSVTAGVSTEP